MTPDALRTLLTEFQPDAAVEVHEDRGLLATVFTAAFEGKHEALRQQMVWQHLRERCSDADLANVAFIFTFPTSAAQAG